MTLTGWIIGVHLLSAHIPAVPNENNVNLGVYVEAPNGITAGTYRNTLRRQSTYLGYTFQYGPVGFTVGGVTGYYRRVTPMAAPSLKLGENVRISYIPRVPNVNNTSVFHLSIERRF